MALQDSLSQGDQGAAYTAYRFGQAGSSLIDRLLAGSPEQRLPDKPMNLVDKGKVGGDNKNTVTNTEPENKANGPVDKNLKYYWDSWSNYEKVTIGDKVYAKVGNRLYSKHAVDRMQPSGNRYGSYIYQAGGGSW